MIIIACMLSLLMLFAWSYPMLAVWVLVALVVLVIAYFAYDSIV